VERLEIKLSEPKGQRYGPSARTIGAEDVERLRNEIGVTPRTDEYSREELFALAALEQEARGFESMRSLARAAGVSPTTAAATVKRLEARGLITRRPGLARMSGHVIEADLLEANQADPAWVRLAPLLSVTRPPIRDTGPEPVIVPRRFWHLFWNVRPATLRIDTNSDFIAARLLLSNDQRAVTWAATHLPAASIKRTAMARGLSEVEREKILGLAISK
jgi:AcrR family transcriptional regulator